LVGVATSQPRHAQAKAAEPDPEESLKELAVLAMSAGADVVDAVLQTRPRLDPATLIGAGKLQEISEQADAFDIDVVLFDRDLSPTQLRNLDRALPAKVLDRTQLILDIFARRARTREGQLQVELAQLNYMLPRLTGRGVEMSRLGGGIGTRGPGETQLETDRRRIFRRIRKIKEQLEGVRTARSVQRGRRQGVPLATVTLVGYTNAGKSTLFNRLTGAGVTADSRMFATLDATLRSLELPSRRRAIAGDTVGFIRNLPTTLVEAFRATLEEVNQASLLVHVIDSRSPDAVEQTRHVLDVLREIGAAGIPQVLAFNKCDLPGPEIDPEAFRLRAALAVPARSVFVSARTGDGLDSLLAAIDELLPVDPLCHATFRIPVSEGRALHLLHEHARITSKERDDSFWMVEADVTDSLLRLLEAYAPKVASSK